MRTLSPRAALLLATLLPALAPAAARGQARPAATVREVEAEYPTYPFGDPNPIPVVGRIYPYFRFDGFSATAVPRRWKIVELENAHLKVQILPEIGGKIWNAVEKRTGRSFIYDNRVVKFRDIAMRGPWTSGGIEANYGIIGHTPTVATPVEYVTRTHPDGSVSCVIGALDLLTRTPWRLEIRLGADEAAFTTTSFWHNASGLEQPYYSWMNAGIPVGGGLQFIYPGTSRLGHDGERGPWPVDEAGRDLSRYDRNDFGGYKSYHVFGRATDFFGAYWHDQDFGMVRHAARDEKAGKKIWIWGLSRQGMIWESLLTDRDGQYAEVQSGRLFNQTAEASTFTPFKHRGFAPQQVDRWTETWYPVVGTKGFVTAGRTAAMNVVRLGDRLAVTILPVAPVADTLVATVGGRRVAARAVVRRTMQRWADTLALPGVPLDSVRLTLGDGALDYALAESAGALARPVEAPPGFDWRSAYGHWLRGKEWLRQREYALARAFMDSALLKDPHYVPALADRALLAVRSGEHERARKDAALALSVDSYDGQANYAYGLANRALGKLDDARDGFEIAAQSPEYRVAAWVELARMAAAAGAWTRATEQSRKALAVAGDNPDALGVALLAARRAGNAVARDAALARLAAVDPLSVQLRLERALAAGDPAPAATVARGLRSELPEQQLLELAAWYLAAGDSAAAVVALEGAGEIPEALYWRAALAAPAQRAGLVARGDAVSPRLVFPFRPEVVPALREAVRASRSWRPRYYLGLALWGMGQVARADSIFTSLGTTPDYAPFYAARASLPARPGAEVRRDLRRAAALDSTEWRYGKLLADHALAGGDALSAVTYAQGAYARFPANYIVGLTLARALVAAGHWADADALLARLEVLPYEGARDGRLLYREAKLGLARAAIAAGRWDRADTLVAAARLWPERLGAGKPYDADVDESAEDSLAAVIAAGRRGVAPRAGSAARAARTPHPDTLVYGTGRWEPDSVGNHRAVLEVDEAADAVTVRIPWRRRDRTPERINVVLTNGTTGQRILNVARVRIDRDSGVLVFQAPAAGRYHAYYLPYTGTFRSNYPRISYRPVEDTADSLWLARTGLAGVSPASALAVANGLPHAAVIGFDAMDVFSAFTPMEYIATQAERRALLAAQGTQPFLAFAEDRALAIRMPDDIPGTWARRGAFRPFAGTARRGEFYSFQVGLWAHRGPVDGVRYRATPLRSAAGGVIPASALTGFNFEGTDWSGRRFTRTVRVDSGAVQALWFGVDVPVGTRPGTYRGRLAVVTAAGTREIPLALTVSATVAPNHGDDVPADLTRLRWLNSQLAADDSVVAPFTPLRLAGRTVSLLGRDLTFGEDGLPAQLRSYFAPNNATIGTAAREILAAPARLAVHDATGGPVAFTGAAPVVTVRAPGAVGWEVRRQGGALQLHTRARLEFDGTVEYAVTLRATRPTTLRDVALELPLQPSAARYLMGLGQKGGYRPPAFRWMWDVAKKNQDAVWIGDVNAGVQLTLFDEHYVRPLNTNFYLSKPLVAPRSWANNGRGGCDVGMVADTAQVLVRCGSGAHVLQPGDSLRFDFRLMITPFKPLDVQGQWATRYFHAFVPVDSAARRGANTINVHHANRVNPWINYPFIETASMRAYIDSAHARGLKAKIYYTVRELTNRAPELFALRSFGDEVLSHGPGGGYSWLQEHLGGDYIAAWHVPAIRDAAVVNSGVSRWHNFYIEGLDWLVRNERIDGLYLDDVAFDRRTMKRIRKVLDRGNPGALLDLHSANQYNPRDGFASSANLYLEHFPFINRLWFGEYFDYDARPDYWLVELSGIPFGLMGEMLEKGGHPWRGMTMGMTARLPWSGDPAPLWRVWDQFGISRSTLHGWWSGRDPVQTGDPALLATTWTRPGGAMIAIGSWHDRDVAASLAIDWAALGIDPARARLRAPAIEQFQAAGSWTPGERIVVPAKKGLLLLVEAR